VAETASIEKFLQLGFPDLFPYDFFGVRKTFLKRAKIQKQQLKKDIFFFSNETPNQKMVN